MKIYLPVLLILSLSTYGQPAGKHLFSKEEWEYPLRVTEIDLSHKSLKVLPPELTRFENLEEIDLSENPNLDLTAAFQLLGNFKKLRSLALYEVNDSIPGEIALLQGLEELNLEKNDLTTIPDGVKKLTRLRRLVLWHNKISYISLQPGNLPNLEEIELGLNQLTAFPDDLSVIPKLRIVSFYKNSISQVSSAISKLSRLEELNLRGNRISSLPVEFGELIRLKKLDLMENQLTSFAHLHRLTGLEELYIGDNRIEVIPAGIFQLTRLRKLSLSDNPINEMPDDLSGLQSLVDISIDGRDSAGLSAALERVATIPGLKTLNINAGGIREMPATFGKLGHISNFQLWDCDFALTERKRLKAMFPLATFNFHKSWGDRSFYKYKPCTMDKGSWDSITVNNSDFWYLLVGQGYKYTDEYGIHYWDGEILLDLDKKLVDRKTAENVLMAIADRLGMEDIIAARTCKVFEIMHSAMPAKMELEKEHYRDNYIGKYRKLSGLERY